jgi:pilus assembly protein Flp/PilA
MGYGQISFRRDESGAAAAEYAMILAVIGVGVVIATLALTGSISGSLDGSSATIASIGTAGASSPGHSGDAPGHTGDAPGLGGSGPPGLTGDAPGKSKH